MGSTKLSFEAVRRRLLAEPSRIDVEGAVVRVIARRDGCTPAAARESLACLSTNIAVDRVFKRVLPEEHKRARGSVEERRFKFFEIMRGLFPIDWNYLDECHMNSEYDEDAVPGEHRFFEYGIIILSMRPFETWYMTHNWDNLPLAYRLTDALFFDDAYPPGGREDERGTRRKWDYLTSLLGLESPVKKVAPADKPALLWAFANAGGALRYVADAYKVLAFDTGSIFYDYDPEDGIEPYEWTSGSVEFLKAQYEVARQVEKRVKALDKWLAADPAGRARRILNYYTKHRRVLANEGRQCVRVGGAQSVALVDVL